MMSIWESGKSIMSVIQILRQLSLTSCTAAQTLSIRSFLFFQRNIPRIFKRYQFKVASLMVRELCLPYSPAGAECGKSKGYKAGLIWDL